MSDMTLTMIFKAVDEATATMKTIMDAEREVQASVQAGSEASQAAAAQAVEAASRQVDALKEIAEATTAAFAAAESGAVQAVAGDRRFGSIEWNEDGFDAERVGLGHLMEIDRQAAVVAERIAAARGHVASFADAIDAETASTLQAVGDALDKSSAGMAGVAEHGGEAAGALAGIGEAAGAAWQDMDKAATAASALGGMGGNFRDAAVIFAGNLAAQLAAAGIGMAAEALAGYVGAWFDHQSKIDAALKGHEQLVRNIKAGWDDTKGAVDSYGEISAAMLRYDAERNLVELEEARQSARGQLEGTGLFNRTVYNRADEEFRRAVDAFRAGDGDGRAFRDDIVEIASQLPGDDWQHQLVRVVREDLRQLIEIEAKIAQAHELEAKFQSPAIDDASAAVAAGADADAAMQATAPAAIAVEAGAEIAMADAATAGAEAFGELARGAAAAAEEMEASERVCRALEPAMSAASGGIDLGADAYQGLDSAAAGATAAVGASATEIERAGSAAAAATEQLGRMQAAMQSLSAVRAATTPITQGFVPQAAALPGYGAGGHTGYLSKDVVVGFVHGNEYVFDADATAAIGVGTLDAIRAAGVAGAFPTGLGEAMAASNVVDLASVRDARQAQAASVAMPAAAPPHEQARAEVAGIRPAGQEGGTTITVQLSAPVTISGDAPRAVIEREVLEVMEKSGRELAKIIDEELRRRARREH